MLLQLSVHLSSSLGASSGLPLQHESAPSGELSPAVENPVESDGPAVCIDLKRAGILFEEFDQVFHLPRFDLAPQLHTSWTMEWWDCCSPVTHVWIYHDGSHKADGSGAAVAAFLFQPARGWVFGGALSTYLDATITSYGAELRAGLIAVQFLIGILKIIALIQQDPPFVCLLHDSTTVGHQLTGQWNANADVRAAALLRHLAVYCEHRFQVCIETAYVAAHTGDVGNELVDSLANLAADSDALHDLQPWLSRVLESEFGQAAAWFWVFFCRHFQDWWDGYRFGLPYCAATQPSLDVLPSAQHAPEVALSGHLRLTVGTCNVLTMRSTVSSVGCAVEVDHGLQGPTRQQIIFRQLREANVCLVALQETRLKKTCKLIEDYMLFAGSATPQGHFGVIVAISKSIPYGTTVDAQGRRKSLFFSEKDISLIATSPRWVILRVSTPWIKFLLLGVHAPHSGQAVDVLETWWKDLEDMLPSTLASWPRLLLADANAKVGADTCSQIGDFGAEAGGDKAEPFTSFVRSQGLWLPSTFDCHQGPCGTWRHPSGKWLRNDFVGLPVQWGVQHCRSWVSDDIDVSLHHEDHRPALVQFELDVYRQNSYQWSVAPKNWTERVI
eukprot:s2501_g2.t1